MRVQDWTASSGVEATSNAIPTHLVPGTNLVLGGGGSRAKSLPLSYLCRRLLKASSVAAKT